MFSNDLLQRVVGRIESRFDGVSPDLLSRVAREVLIAAETDRADSTHARFDGADTPAPATPAPAEKAKPVNRDRESERRKAYEDHARDEASLELSQMWKRGGKQ